MRRGSAAFIYIGVGLLTLLAEVALNYDPRTYWLPYMLVGSVGLVWDAVGYVYVDRRQTKIKASQIDGEVNLRVTADRFELDMSGDIKNLAIPWIEPVRLSPDPGPAFLRYYAVIALLLVITWFIAQWLP